MGYAFLVSHWALVFSHLSLVNILDPQEANVKWLKTNDFYLLLFAASFTGRSYLRGA